MSKIPQPRAIPLNDNGEWVLTRDYKLDGFIVPKGFIFDGASIPRAFWTILNITPIGWHMPASLIHDYLYRNTGVVTRHGKVSHYSKYMADKEFHRLLRRLNVRSWHASLCYSAVKVFGFKAWNENIKRGDDVCV